MLRGGGVFPTRGFFNGTALTINAKIILGTQVKSLSELPSFNNSQNGLPISAIRVCIRYDEEPKVLFESQRVCIRHDEEPKVLFESQIGLRFT